MVGVLAVVDWRPFVTGAEVVGQAVVVGETVIFRRVSKLRSLVVNKGLCWSIGDGPYSTPYLSINSAPSWLASHQGATWITFRSQYYLLEAVF